MTETKKTKVLVIADNPLAPSGVGTQTKYMIESMLRTREFSFVCLAGAIKHQDYSPMKVDPFGDDWVIIPVDGYGNPDVIRTMTYIHKPDILWFMTDPRFWGWLWEMEPEIRPHMPMVYYHVWDNYPYPKYNIPYYESNDMICTISKVTDDIVRTLCPNKNVKHIPHTVDTNIFKKMPPDEYEKFESMAGTKGKFTIFWNNRNARRKQSGTVLFWFNDFLNQVGRDKATIIMHTEPNDPHGQDLEAIINELDMAEGQAILSIAKVGPDDLARMYSMADCTVNIADAEGFGLATLESLACETPIIVNMTGGLQEQVTDGEQWFGIGIEPTSKAIIGSQDVPYIYEDRCCREDFLKALHQMYNMSPEERESLGRSGRGHVLKNYSMSKYAGNWYTALKSMVEEQGSWEQRKQYKSYTLEEF